MTPNHGYTPTDDRKRAQATSGQQPTGQQAPQGGQPVQQNQPIQQPGSTQPTQQRQQQWPQHQPQQRQPVQQGPVQQAAPPQASGTQQQVQPAQRSQQQPTGPIAGQQEPTGGMADVQSQQATSSGVQAQQAGSGRSPGQQVGGGGVQAQQAGGLGVQERYSQPTGARPQSQPQRPRQPILKPIRVNEIITEDVVTAEKDTPVRTVVAQMTEHNVGSVVVVEEDRPIGIVTDRKIALALEEMPDIAQRTAEELLHGDVFTADPSMSIFDAIQVMSDEGIRRLPIVDDNGALRGIVTLDDALVLLGGVVSDVAATVQSQSPKL